MAKNHDTNATLAEALGLTKPTINCKINGLRGRQFKASELQAIVKRWNLTADQAEEIFFPGE